VASAALGAPAVLAADPAREAPLHSPPTREAILLRVARSIGPWERPEDVLSAAYLTSNRVAGDFRSHRLSASPAPGLQDPPLFRFDIPPGPLAVALRLFEQATNVTVRVSADLTRNLTSPGVRGLMTADQALGQILADSQLTHRFTGMGTAVVEVRPVSEAVRVTAADALPAVTSPKFTAPLLDTPQTVTVVPKAVMEAQGATTLRDVLRNVPGITMQAGEGGGGLPGDTLTIRGFSATSDIFVDGLREVGPYARDAFNLEQVEVVKGPSSALGGRGSTGGAVNVVTKLAGLEPIGQGTLGLGSSGYQRTTVDVNGRLRGLGEGAAVRLNAMWQDVGVPGREVVNNKGWGLALAVRRLTAWLRRRPATSPAVAQPSNGSPPSSSLATRP
jgi:catecholate siderophore receptor